MTPRYPFPHQGRVHVVADDHFEVAYYARNYRKYKRIRQIGLQTWEEAIEQEIDNDHFWMVAACVERGKLVRNGMV